MVTREAYRFDPGVHRRALRAIVDAIAVELSRSDRLEPATLETILRRHPPPAGGVFSKAQLLAGFRWLQRREALPLSEAEMVRHLRTKPVRTLSGVAPVTVLTEPWPCPGRCVFCPSDVRMPKSYLSSEPGARRAAEHRFDPWSQTTARLRALHRTGHDTSKVELIVLGGTWSSYPRSYQRWFVERCFAALNWFRGDEEVRWPASAVDWRTVPMEPERLRAPGAYDRVVSGWARRHGGGAAATRTASWQQLEAVQRENETARSRCVGLVVETRPDRVDEAEIVRLRRLGVTKVQLGIQSLDDRVLTANRRAHDVATTRRAVALLRGGGFKIHGHWMANLVGATPEADRRDFRRLFEDPAVRPDELKIYPCSLVETAELMEIWRRGEWRPYDVEELVELLLDCLAATPRWCRLTRIVRDIPGTDIVAGSRVTNLRQVVEERAAQRGIRSRDVRAREIRDDHGGERPQLRETRYRTSVGEECFLELVTRDDRLVGFLRLSLPAGASGPTEVAASAMIREVHVYGRVAAVGSDDSPAEATAVQHRGLGSRLVDRAVEIATAAGFADLAVISAVGTRVWYRRLGFVDGELYQHRALAAAPPKVAIASVP